MYTSILDEVDIPVGKISLKGNLSIPGDANGIIIFSHGSGSSRLSSRNNLVAKFLNEKKFGTLLFDLLTLQEDQNYNNRFDIGLLSDRLIKVTEWITKLTAAKNFQIGYFGASTGAASALEAAAALPQITAVVSRGGRPDLAMQSLYKVKAATLLIVGSLDLDVLQLNRKAYSQLRCEKKLEVVEGASHLFEEAGKMQIVSALALNWFQKYLAMVKVKV